MNINSAISLCIFLILKDTLLVMIFLFLQCQSLMEELSASHSTDLQQRAYELQALIGLDAHAVASIMPADKSCQDIEVILQIFSFLFLEYHVCLFSCCFFILFIYLVLKILFCVCPIIHLFQIGVLFVCFLCKRALYFPFLLCEL